MATLSEEIGFTDAQTQMVISQGFDLLEAGNLDAAAVVFEGLLALDPAQAGIQAALGSVLHQQGKLPEALAAYDTALAMDPKVVLARVNRGELRCKRGDLGGLEDLEIAAKIPSAVQARAKAAMRLYGR